MLLVAVTMTIGKRKKKKKKKKKSNKTGWWFQPIWKILVKLEIFPK